MALRVCQLCAVDFTLKNFLLPLVDQMQNKGWDVTCVCCDGPHVAALRGEGYNIFTIKISRSFNLILHLRAVFELAQFFRQNKFDIVHVHSPIAALIGRFAAFIARVPLVVYTAHGFYFHDGMPKLKYTFFLNLEKICSPFTDLLFTQSSEDAEVALQEKLAPKESILKIGNGVSLEKFAPQNSPKKSIAKAQLGIRKNKFVVGIIARLVQEKGISEFLDAAQLLAKDYKDIQFMVVGSKLSSDHSASVEERIIQAKSQLSQRIIFTGHAEEIPLLLSAMDVFCLPSWREGMPRSIIEAMMMGRPVVATNIRGSRELVVDGVTGYLIPVKDAFALANAISKIYEDRNLALRMGTRAREIAVHHFDETKIISTQIQKIEEVLKR